MTQYFYAMNEHYEDSIINENYQNLFFSRKVLAKNLPIENVNESAGYVVKGSHRFRYIELQNNELFVAVGGYINRRMPYFIFKGLKVENNEIVIKHLICPSEKINANYDPRNSAGNWMNDTSSTSRTEVTNLNEYDMPDDLYVYVFSTTPGTSLENFGLQVFAAPAQGEVSGKVLLDSRYKYLNVIKSSRNVDSEYVRDLLNTKRLAVGTIYPVISGYAWLYTQGPVLFERNYVDPLGKSYPNVTVGSGMRFFDSVYHWYDLSFGSEYFVIDVTGF